MASERPNFAPIESRFQSRFLFSRDEQHLQAVQDSHSKISNHAHSVVEICDENHATSQNPSSTFQNAITKWSAIFTMSSCFLLSLILAVGHHCYYLWLDGQVVGDSDRQQWALRFGSAFGALVGAFLKIAVGCAYIQYVWLRLRQKNISLRALDATFDVLGNPWQLLKFEMVRFLNFAVVVIFISWCIPLSQIFPAATLSVRVHVDSEIRPFEAMRPSLMYHGKEVTEDGSRWAPSLYYTSVLDIINAPGRGSLSTQEIYEDVSFDFRLLSTAVALGGKVIPPHISIPYSNYTYSMAVYLPRIRCQPSDPSLFPLNQSSIFPWLTDLDYWAGPNGTEFAFNMSDFTYSSIPLDSPNNYTGGLQYLALAEIVALGLDRRPLNNVSYDQRSSYDQRVVENLIRTRRTGRLDIAINMIDTHSVSTFGCHVYNSSFEIDVAVNRGSSKISIREIVDIGPVEIGGVGDALRDPRYALVDFWFMRITDLFLGVWTKNYALPKLMDIPLLGRPLETWVPYIEEISNNLSLSLMSDDGYCMPVMVDANFTTVQNVYDYHPQNLLISYGIVLVFTFVALILGIFSFQRNGTSYDTLISTIGTSMQHPEVAKILKDIPLGTTSIDPIVMNVRMRFGTYETLNEGNTTIENTQKLGFIPIAT